MMRFIIVGTVLLTGCSGVSKVGTIGNTDFYSVHASHFDGPNYTALVTQKHGEAAKIEKIIGGSGIGSGVLPALIDAGGQIGSSASYDPDGDSISVNSSGGKSGSVTSSTGDVTLKNNADNVNVKTDSDNRTTNNNNNVKVGN